MCTEIHNYVTASIIHIASIVVYCSDLGIEIVTQYMIYEDSS